MSRLGALEWSRVDSCASHRQIETVKSLLIQVDLAEHFFKFDDKKNLANEVDCHSLVTTHFALSRGVSPSLDRDIPGTGLKFAIPRGMSVFPVTDQGGFVSSSQSGQVETWKSYTAVADILSATNVGL